jgi:DNA-binding transcriptional ArsR family regulator
MKLPIKEYLKLKETTGYHLAKELGISPSRVGHWTKKQGIGAETMIHFTRAGITHVVRELTVHPREGMM